MHDLILEAQKGWEHYTEHYTEHEARLSDDHSNSEFICDCLWFQCGCAIQRAEFKVQIEEACAWIRARIGYHFGVEDFIRNKTRVVANEKGVEVTDFYLFVDKNHPAVIAERRKIWAELLAKYPKEAA